MFILSISGCVTELPSLVHPDQVTGSLVVGRVSTVLTGERSRRYLPQLRFLEFEDLDSQKSFQVQIESPDKHIALDVPPGTYRLTRLQISEGPFLSMADVVVEFSVTPNAITYVGTWRFGIDSPRYGRKVVVSMVSDQDSRDQIRDFLTQQYPTFNERSIVEGIPHLSYVEAQLYEVMPYPRYPRYFRRHWW